MKKNCFYPLVMLLFASLLLPAGCATGPVEDNNNPQMNTAADTGGEEDPESEAAEMPAPEAEPAPTEEASPTPQPTAADTSVPILEPSPLQ